RTTTSGGATSRQPSGRRQGATGGGRPLTVLCVQPVAERGGSDQALLRMARQLGASGWSVHVALPSPSPMADEFAAAGAVLHLVPMKRISTSHDGAAWAAYVLGWPASVLRLWGLSRRVQADVVLSNSLHSWYGWAVALLAGRPHIWHAREIVTQSPKALRTERFLARWFARRVIAASEAVAAQLAPANVVIIHEEAGPDEFHPGRAGQARHRYGLADRSPAIGYVGRVDTWKGLDVLLDAVPALVSRRHDAQVVIAGPVVTGKEAYAAALAQRATDLGVHWLGPLTGGDAGDLIADLDCLVLASTTPEPWGLVLVEALACGVPVVATGAGGPLEILAGLPHAGRLVPASDPGSLAAAIADLLPPATSAELRRGRRVLRNGVAPPYPDLFAAVAERLD
ncbi:MAG: glycosyltransferase family 4 protein, partial [Acidimicrobiales bacterium]